MVQEEHSHVAGAAVTQADPRSSTAAHTPGPWRAQPIAFISDFAVLGEGRGTAIAQCFFPEALGNAHLIAAAPDLLEACKEFVRKVEAGEAKSKRSYAQMSAAIAKAEGR